jgi:hypothetical protein
MQALLNKVPDKGARLPTRCRRSEQSMAWPGSKEGCDKQLSASESETGRPVIRKIQEC